MHFSIEVRLHIIYVEYSTPISIICSGSSQVSDLCFFRFVFYSIVYVFFESAET